MAAETTQIVFHWWDRDFSNIHDDAALLSYIKSHIYDEDALAASIDFNTPSTYNNVKPVWMTFSNPNAVLSNWRVGGVLNSDLEDAIDYAENLYSGTWPNGVAYHTLTRLNAIINV